MANISCPKCGSSNVANILYGMPTSDAMKLATTGKVVLGGCVIGMNNPQFHCNDCENRWSREMELNNELSN